MTVSQLTGMVKSALNCSFPAEIRVIGELSNVSRPSGGHIYFTLKDPNSEVRCVMWRSSAQSVKFELCEGLEIVASGTIDVYEPRGQYQLYVRKMTPCGAGALDLAFQQLKAKLESEGLFATDRKRPLPRIPRTIGVVTSPTGAAIRDIIHTISRRFAGVRILVFGVRVQGEGAAAEIADAIRRMNHTRADMGGVDVLIVGRGGGSIEDLWAFNEEVVARAIVASQIPVVSAVGHEVDTTIADLVADVRAATPTAAAELVVPVLTDVIDLLDGVEHRLRHAVRRRMEASRLRLAVVERTGWFRDPVGQVRRLHQRVDEMSGRLRLAATRRIQRLRGRTHDLEIRMVRARPMVQIMRRRERTADHARRLENAMLSAIRKAEARIRKLSHTLAANTPRQRVVRERIRVAQIETLLHQAMHRCLHDHRKAVAVLAARLDASSHTQVLRRGFSISRRAKDGKVIRGPEDVQLGTRVITETAEGTFDSKVVDHRQGDLFE